MSNSEKICPACDTSNQEIDGDEIDGAWHCFNCVASNEGEDDKDSYLNYKPGL